MFAQRCLRSQPSATVRNRSSFSQDELQYSWQEQHFEDLCRHFAWQKQHSTLYTLSSTLYTPHSTLYTPHSTLYPLHSILHTLHSTLYKLHSSLHTLHSTLHTLDSTLYTLHFTLHTLHFTLHTPHSTLYTLHCALLSPHFTLDIPHFALHTLHSTLYTLQYTLFRIPQPTVHWYGNRGKIYCSITFFHNSVLRDCILVRGLHLVLFQGPSAPRFGAATSWHTISSASVERLNKKTLRDQSEFLNGRVLICFHDRDISIPCPSQNDPQYCNMMIQHKERIIELSIIIDKDNIYRMDPAGPS